MSELENERRLRLTKRLQELYPTYDLETRPEEKMRYHELYILPLEQELNELGGELTQKQLLQDYLNDLLTKLPATFIQNVYTSQSGEFRQDKPLIPPSDLMPTSFLFQPKPRGYLEDGDDVSHGKPTHHDNVRQAFEQYKQLVLLGEPGTGKSFSLFRIAIEFAQRADKNLDEALIPVVVPLNEWVAEQQSLEEFVKRRMGCLAPQYDTLRREKRLCLLLDALNEIPVGQRSKKMPQVSSFIQQPYWEYLLLTCRERDYASLPLPLDRLTIEALNYEQVWQFLQNYFCYFAQQRGINPQGGQELFWHLADGDAVKSAWQAWKKAGASWQLFLTASEISIENPDVYFKTSTKQKTAWRNMRHNQRCLLKLASNPYLLTLISSLYASTGALPKDRIDLFTQAINQLFIREQDSSQKRGDVAIDQAKLVERLKALAWHLQGYTPSEDESNEEQARTVVPRDQAIRLLEDEDYLRFAHSANVLDFPQNSVRFSHQLLQEYFTAQSFRDQINNGLQASDLWGQDWWQAKGWEEAARLAAEYELSDSVQSLRLFLQWLVKGNPKLAAEIAKEHDQLDQDLFITHKSQWQAAITDDESHPNPHERHHLSTLLAWLDWDERPYIGLNQQGLPDINWLEVPAGEFIYGDGDDQKTLDLDTFYVSRYPITNKQFQAFIDAGGYEQEQWWVDIEKPDKLPNHEWTEGNRPVERVSWYDAIAFCRWLSVQTGKNIRLPTEEQWEKAARGTDARTYPWGNEYHTGLANIDETWGDSGKYYLQATSAVGIYPKSQSPYQAMEMAGNVSEWCLNQDKEPSNIAVNTSNSSRVVRGGSWFFFTEDVRVFARYNYFPRDRHSYGGFRGIFSLSITDH